MSETTTGTRAALDFLLSEAMPGPWRPEPPHEDDLPSSLPDFWLTNDAGDSLHFDAQDAAVLLNAALERRVPLGVWEAADGRASSWEDSYREIFHAAYSLTHCVGSGQYLRSFEALAKLVAEHEAIDRQPSCEECSHAEPIHSADHNALAPCSEWQCRCAGYR